MAKDPIAQAGRDSVPKIQELKRRVKRLEEENARKDQAIRQKDIEIQRLRKLIKV